MYKIVQNDQFKKISYGFLFQRINSFTFHFCVLHARKPEMHSLKNDFDWSITNSTKFNSIMQSFNVTISAECLAGTRGGGTNTMGVDSGQITIVLAHFAF